MKNVLISIKPKYCEAIFVKHKKKYEIRKSRPKCDPPFDCYVYATKEPSDTIRGGYVIGEFECKKIIDISEIISIKNWKKSNNKYVKLVMKQAGLNEKQFRSYIKDSKECYAYEISDELKYISPMEISMFKESSTPPQSWCYVSAIKKYYYEIFDSSRINTRKERPSKFYVVTSSPAAFQTLKQQLNLPDSYRLKPITAEEYVNEMNRNNYVKYDPFE